MSRGPANGPCIGYCPPSLSPVGTIVRSSGAFGSGCRSGMGRNGTVVWKSSGRRSMRRSLTWRSSSMYGCQGTVTIGGEGGREPSRCTPNTYVMQTEATLIGYSMVQSIHALPRVRREKSTCVSSEVIGSTLEARIQGHADNGASTA